VERRKWDLRGFGFVFSMRGFPKCWNRHSLAKRLGKVKLSGVTHASLMIGRVSIHISDNLW
jgi:hypothetical protein